MTRALYSVLFLTPETMIELLVRRALGQTTLDDGVPIRSLMDAFHNFIEDLKTDEPPLACSLCDVELRDIAQTGCVIGLYDAQRAGTDQRTDTDLIWCAACKPCHDENPATVQRRILERGGTIMEVSMDHPTPQ